MLIKEILANVQYKGKETEQNIDRMYSDTIICPKQHAILNIKYCENECRECLESENKGWR